MIQEEAIVESYDRTKLHCVIKEHGSPVWIIVTHGLAEYGGRHQYFFKVFAQYFNVLIYDLRGHGKSGGRKAYVYSFEDYSKDLEAIVEFLQKKYVMKKHILFGHSMGGLIVSRYMRDRVKKENYPERVFLSAPMLAAYGVMGKILHLAPTGLAQSLASLSYTLPLKGLIDNKKLSHDARVFLQVDGDPMMHKAIHSRLLLQMVAAARDLVTRPLRINCPLYCAMGSDDHIVDFSVVQDYFTKIEKNCRFHPIEGGYHELHNEVSKYREPYLQFLKASLMNELFQEGLD